MILFCFFISLALCLDAIVVSFAYGASNIKIPTYSSVFISMICTGFLFVSCLLGKFLSPIFPDHILKFVSFFILFIIGVSKVFDCYIKNIIKTGIKKEVNIFHLNIILKIYADPKTADFDNSSVISLKEAFSLAFALSLDGIGSGIGIGFANINLAWLVGFSFIFTIIAIKLGTILQNKISGLLDKDISFLGGIILIIISLIKLLV